MNFINLPKFVDCLFPPTNDSIYENSILKSKLTTAKIYPKNVIHNWLRPDAIKFNNSCQQLSVYNAPNPCDIFQGAVGSCWYLAALSSLVDSPWYLKNLFVDQCNSNLQCKQINLSGCYDIRLCVRGKWQIITIDDFFPCNYYGKPVFAKIKNKQIYAALLEKALAKVNGNYEAITSGTCYEGLQTLTGQPCNNLLLRNIEELEENETFCSERNWTEILAAKKSHYLMTTLCYNRLLQADIFKLVGLYYAHIYSVLDVRELCYKAKPLRLLKLRNPWGKHIWKGKWSNPLKWPCEIRSQIEDCQSSGTFWIEFKDFLHYFTDLTICKTRPTWMNYRFSSNFQDFSNYVECYKFEVNQPDLNKIDIELFYDGKNNELFDRDAEVEIDLFLILCKIDVYGLTCIKYKQKLKDYITFDAPLECGHYIVFVTSMKAIMENENEQCCRNIYKYNIVFHTPKEIHITKIMQKADVVSDFLYTITLKENKFKRCHATFKDIRFTDLSNLCSHGILAENNSLTNCVDITVDASKSKNLTTSRELCCKSNHLCPGQRQWIFYGFPQNVKKKLLLKLNENIQLISNNYFHFYYNCIKDMFAKQTAFDGLHAIK